MPFNPGVTSYYDFDLDRFTAELDFGHVFTIAEFLYVEPGLTLGLSDANDNLDYQWGTSFLEIGADVGNSASIYARVSYAVSTADTFADTSFDLSNPDTLELPDNSSNWFVIGVSARF